MMPLPKMKGKHYHEQDDRTSSADQFTRGISIKRYIKLPMVATITAVLVTKVRVTAPALHLKHNIWCQSNGKLTGQ